jgi:hypothetical protein
VWVVVSIVPHEDSTTFSLEWTDDDFVLIAVELFRGCDTGLEQFAGSAVKSEIVVIHQFLRRGLVTPPTHFDMFDLKFITWHFLQSKTIPSIAFLLILINPC